jgi:hypothetical protein
VALYGHYARGEKVECGGVGFVIASERSNPESERAKAGARV